MRKTLAVRAALATTLAGLSGAAQAAGDSGTGSMGEMNVSAGMLLAMVGALVVMGLVIWGIIKVMNK
jgi:flagellar biogenesis protein FliO